MRQLMKNWRLWVVAGVCVVVFGGFTMIPLWMSAVVFCVAAFVAAAWTRQPINAWAWLTQLVMLMIPSLLFRMVAVTTAANAIWAFSVVVITAVLASGVGWSLADLAFGKRSESAAEKATDGGAVVRRWQFCPMCRSPRGFGRAKPPELCSLCHSHPIAYVGALPSQEHKVCSGCGELMAVDACWCPFCGSELRLGQPSDQALTGSQQPGLMPR